MEINKDEFDQLHNDSAELRSLKMSILESRLKEYFPKREMSFHDKVVFAIGELTDNIQNLNKKNDK